MAIPQDVLNSIQIDYKRNLKPQEIAKKYNLTSKQVYNIVYNNGWNKAKKDNNKKFEEKISKKLDNTNEAEVAKIKSGLRVQALLGLQKVLNDPDAKNMEIVQASKAVLDITGDKTQTQNITGSIQQNTKYVLPEEWQDINKHIDDFINN